MFDMPSHFSFFVQFLVCFWTFSLTLAETNTAERNRNELQRLVEDHRSYCGISDSCNYTETDYCHCDLCSCEPECIKSDNCCPEVIIDLWNIQKPEVLSQCISSSYRGFKSEFNYTMIAECPLSFKTVSQNKDVVDKCERRYESNYIGDVIPVEDGTNITYANKYCAECNSVPSSDLKYQWLVEVKCKKALFLPRSFNTLLADINATRDCDIVFSPKEILFEKACDKVISSCNETGLWETYDSFVEQACSAYKSPYMKKYRNPFCAVCNENDVVKYKRSVSGCVVDVGNPDLVPFSALLTFETAQSDGEVNFGGKCRQDQIYDTVSNVCRDLLCEFGKRLNNGSCEPLYSQSSGLCYQFYVKITPLGNRSVDTKKNGTKSTNHASAYSPEDVVYAFENDIFGFAQKFSTDGELRNISFYKIENNIDSKEILIASMFFYISYLLDDSAFIDGVNRRYNNKNISLSIQNGIREIFNIYLIRLQQSSEYGVLSPLSGDVIFPFNSKTIHYREVTCAAQKIFTVTTFSFHPFVRLDNSSYTWDVNSSGVIIYELKVFVENELFRETDDRSAIFVSLESFKAALPYVKGNSVSKIDGLVSLVVMSISVCCLLITLFTYSLFHVLRSQPGINNMILCICLIFGYLIFMLGSNQTHLGHGCKILGGAIHFSWIFTFFWMNVCSFHMYQVFGSLDQPKQSTKSVSLTAFYLLYSTLSSVCVIGINIGITHDITGGKSFGYGPEKTGICYISEPIMTLYTMALPAICVVIINIIMFSVVINRVRRISIIQKHVKNDKNYFSVYVKLSTITGMAWIAAVPMMVLQSVIFNYIFIALTCSQGVYLMIAFTCNRRVLKLFSGKRRSKKPPSSSTDKKHVVTSSVKSESDTIESSVTLTSLSTDEAYVVTSSKSSNSLSESIKSGVTMSSSSTDTIKAVTRSKCPSKLSESLDAQCT